MTGLLGVAPPETALITNNPKAVPGFSLQSFFAKIQGQKKDFRFNPSRSKADSY